MLTDDVLVVLRQEAFHRRIDHLYFTLLINKHYTAHHIRKYRGKLLFVVLLVSLLILQVHRKFILRFRMLSDFSRVFRMYSAAVLFLPEAFGHFDDISDRLVNTAG